VVTSTTDKVNPTYLYSVPYQQMFKTDKCDGTIENIFCRRPVDNMDAQKIDPLLATFKTPIGILLNNLT